MDLQEKLSQIEMEIANNTSQVLALETRNKELKKQKSAILKMIEKLKEVLK